MSLQDECTGGGHWLQLPPGDVCGAVLGPGSEVEGTDPAKGPLPFLSAGSQEAPAAPCAARQSSVAWAACVTIERSSQPKLMSQGRAQPSQWQQFCQVGKGHFCSECYSRWSRDPLQWRGQFCRVLAEEGPLKSQGVPGQKSPGGDAESQGEQARLEGDCLGRLRAGQGEWPLSGYKEGGLRAASPSLPITIISDQQVQSSSKQKCTGHNWVSRGRRGGLGNPSLYCMNGGTGHIGLGLMPHGKVQVAGQRPGGGAWPHK